METSHPDDDDALSPHALSSYASSSGDSDADRREFGVFRALPTAATRGGAAGSDADSEYDAAVAYLAGVRQEAAAAPAVVVANRSSVDDYVASRSAGQPACLSPAKHTPTHTAATAVALDSPWLRSCLDTFGDVRTRVLAARDAATPDPLSPSFATAAPPPPLPPLPSSPDTATWPPGPASARGLAATPQPTILAALVAVADACGDGQPPLPAPAARWAHALAANLEKPLPSPAAAALARMATAAGADAAAARGDADRAARAAVVAAVAGGWFGQCASLAAAARVD